MPIIKGKYKAFINPHTNLRGYIRDLSSLRRTIQEFFKNYE